MGHVFIAASLDGFIARPDGDLDWLMKQATDGEDHGYDAFVSSVDGLIMGRGTYEKVLTFGDWPYSKPVVVLSATLRQSEIREDLEGRVRVSDASPRAIMKELAGEGWEHAYVDGGQVIQGFLREGLIADMVVTCVPVLLGQGIPLFGPLPGDIDLELKETRAYPSGLVRLEYRIAASG